MGEHVYKLLACCVPHCHCSLLKKCEIVIVNVCKHCFVEQINKFKPKDLSLSARVIFFQVGNGAYVCLNFETLNTPGASRF